MANVCFIVNHEKTMLWAGIARLLGKAGHAVYWIAPGPRWIEWVNANGIPNSGQLVCPLRRKVTRAIDWELVRSLERDSPYTLIHCITMDRTLRQLPDDVSFMYVYSVAEQTLEFLEKNNIDVVFGEATWALELVVNMICNYLKEKYYKPQTIRLPPGRFGFMPGHLENTLAFIREPGTMHLEIAENFVNQFRNRPVRPAFFKQAVRKPSPELVWITKTFRHILSDASDFLRGETDPTEPSTVELIKKRTSEVANYKLARMFSRRLYMRRLEPERPFVMYTMHLQPEASIDVLGSYFSDQINNVKTIRKIVPSAYAVLVKDHPGALGAFGLSFYRKLLSIPGVYLVDPFIDSRELAQRAELVITVSGTAAYEAGLFGKPAVTLSPMFYGRLPTVTFCSNHIELENTITSRLYNEDAGVLNVSSIVEAVAYIIANSFTGNVECSRWNYNWAAEDNLEAVAVGFLDALEIIGK